MPPLSLQPKGAAFMAMHTADFDAAAQPIEPETGLSRAALRCLLRILASALPAADSHDREFAADRWDLARELFFAMGPRNAVEASLAARAVAAHFAAMDLYARAALPGTSDEKAMRLRGKAIAESRSFDTALRDIDKRHVLAAKAEKAPPPRPAAAPIPQARTDRATPGVHVAGDGAASLAWQMQGIGEREPAAAG